MSLKKCAALLLLIGVITARHTAEASECDFPNKTSSNLYQMSISPEVLYNDTVYTVNITGNSNESVTVLLQALSNNTAAGTWSLNGSSICIGGPLLNYTFDANTSLIANWTSSPSSSIPDSVDLIVSIRNGSVSYKLSKTLHAGSASAASSIQPYSMFLALIETLSLLVITSKLL
ncbi:hypothetical protein AB205_0075620 [Aquarana catesbeiana]|uniref:Placenta-expressed transcript 1 protein n=1 Tax=Aquarana catesbeiana TaxID=8400 RepID=A0A2G9QHZ3_AQUCT|nr:hypothetical protein AB205_0075620 [Aquarana catesbeiana]